MAAAVTAPPILGPGPLVGDLEGVTIVPEGAPSATVTGGRPMGPDCGPHLRTGSGGGRRHGRVGSAVGRYPLPRWIDTAVGGS